MHPNSDSSNHSPSGSSPSGSASSESSAKSWLDRVVVYSLSSSLPLIIIVLSLILGAMALHFTPREEEPQIVVPMLDVLVNSPGLSARQVERQVTVPLEKLLAQIPGVEHVYSTSSGGQASVTLRFYVGEDREDAILNTYNKLYSNQHSIPRAVQKWQVQPVEVDDVPILMLGLWSDASSDGQRAEQSDYVLGQSGYELEQSDFVLGQSDFELRRVAEEISTYFQALDDISEVKVVGGRPRQIRISLKPESLSARQSTSQDIIQALQVSNVLQEAGGWALKNESIQVESGDFIRSLDALKQTVINVVDGVPVFLQDVADIQDGPADAKTYTWIDFSSNHPLGESMRSLSDLPMVAISIAKQQGTNAVSVSDNVHQLLDELRISLLPPTMHIEVLRDYGETANEKVDNLTASLAFAVFTVVVFIAVFLGWRPALVVGLAVPISYGVTLALDMAFGYTINRVTLFALILSLGLLVDDPITGVDNIERFLKKKSNDGSNKLKQIVAAISEIKIPLVMSTITIMLAFIPLAFITGMMGPYMAPMAFNVPLSVIVSTLVAFLVTPWLTSKILRSGRSSPEQTALEETSSEMVAAETKAENGKDKSLYRRLLLPIISSRRKSKLFLWTVLALFIAAAVLPMMRWVPLKLLPFDNKNEIQILIDMPESSTLEHSAALAKKISQKVAQVNEVYTVAAFVGVPSPIDFNGMVRHYYQRVAPYFADLRVVLVDKDERRHQSHAIVLRLRELLAPFNRDGVMVKVVEVPPGPPVLSTLVAEVYGSKLSSYEELQQAAQLVQQRLQNEALVVEVDTSVEADQQRLRFEVDKTSAALSGISTGDISQTLKMAIDGLPAGYFQAEREATPLAIRVELPLAQRSTLVDLARLQVKGQSGVVKQHSGKGLDTAPQPLVALGELGEFKSMLVDKSIHHKDLKPVVYVIAELSGRTPAAVIADVSGDLGKVAFTDRTDRNSEVSGRHERHFFSLFTGNNAGDSWTLPENINIKWGGEGEWLITVDVFRDMGLAFMFALIGIFVVLKIQTSSTALSLIIMSAIPLTIIGIMPGFAVLNLFGEREIAGAPDPVLFTATAMIGMIALAGIVVRNSLILVEFISQARAQGMAMKEALLQAGAVRMRPVLLTAGTTMLGNIVIILDPVFSGLALAIMFGIIASTLFTLVLVPVVYMLVFGKADSDPNNQENCIDNGIENHVEDYNAKT